MSDEVLKDVFSRIEGYVDDMIALQTELVATPALGPENDGEGELEKSQLLEKWMEDEIGFDSIEHYDAPDDRVSSGKRPNMIAKIRGESSDKTIWVMAHMDVVPPGDLKLWDTDPYKVVKKEGRIYGRGVEDNHHGIITSLFALKGLKEAGVTPAYDIGIALVSDEETGSKYGIQYLLENYDLFGREDFILVPDSGVADGSQIEVAEKSIYWLKFVTEGKSCHASSPEQGINAHRAAANLITRLDKKLHQIYDKKDPVFDPPESTFEPTRKEANVPNVNSIPGEDVFYMDMRVHPDYPLDDVHETISGIIKEVEEEFGVTVTTSPAQREDAAPATPVDAPVVEALAESIKTVYGIEGRPIGIGGGTVAAFFRRAGLNAVVWSKIDDICHQPNEYEVIENMPGDAKVFAHLFTRK